MVTIGNTKLPGVQTTVESASSTGVNVGAALEVGIVGQADLSAGSANANQVYEVTTPVKARDYFGDGSPLTVACIDALTEGAYPIHAVAVEEKSVTGEDISGTSGTSGTLAEGPVVEGDAGSVTFTVDSTAKTVVETLGDPANETPGTDEVYFNPVTGEFELDSSVSTSGDVDYTYLDFPAACDAMWGEADDLDVIGLTTENAAAVADALTEAEAHDDLYEFTAVVAGAGTYLDPASFSNPHDSSRIQLLYPSRNGDDETIIGSYLGLRASLGINASPMFKRLSTQKDLRTTLSRADQENLVDAYVVPLADESRGARVVEDLTCVDSSNADEQSMSQLLHRLIVDYVTEVVNVLSERYIGELHTVQARNALEGEVSSEMNQLLSLQAITGYSVTVEKVDSLTASLDVGVNTVDPLRNIVATVAAGEVANAA